MLLPPHGRLLQQKKNHHLLGKDDECYQYCTGKNCLDLLHHYYSQFGKILFTLSILADNEASFDVGDCLSTVIISNSKQNIV